MNERKESKQGRKEVKSKRKRWWHGCFDIYHHHVASSARVSLILWPSLPKDHRFRQVIWSASRIYTELLYACSNWSSCIFSAMWRGPQQYIIYELVPTSPAVSCMLGSSNLECFFVMGGWWPYSSCLWGVASGICSILLTAFWCSCCRALSPSVYLASI